MVIASHRRGADWPLMRLGVAVCGRVVGWLLACRRGPRGQPGRAARGRGPQGTSHPVGACSTTVPGQRRRLGACAHHASVVSPRDPIPQR
jgi:hypothetical protein